MKSLHGFLDGVPRVVAGPPSRGGLDANSGIACQLNNQYNLWMRFEGPHNYMVMALGSCVKWP